LTARLYADDYYLNVRPTSTPTIEPYPKFAKFQFSVLAAYPYWQKDENAKVELASIEYGLHAKEMGGGSVNPLTGAFNFAVREGYMIRNGKICEPVRGASLIGTGSQILQDIDMVGQNLATGQGVCGSSSGSVPTDVGQPLIRVKKITVGGR
jgi:TldD protein